MKVYLLTPEQKDLLVNKEFTIDSYFNPIIDMDGNWFISIEEVEKCDNEIFINWIKELPLINYKPIS